MAPMKHQRYSLEFPVMNSLSPPFLLIIHFSLLILLTNVSASPHKIPRLSVLHERIFRDPCNFISASASKHFETLFYTQTLDHFNYQPESYATFKQKYVINSKYWGGAHENAPIFVYLGAEEPLDDDLQIIGFLSDNAPHFKALQVYIEHRFYGESVPFGSIDDAMQNTSTRGYFNSAQAIADYAEVIVYLKKKLSARNSPVIVVGGSYGGMLASWFRLKYPHIALGALASSAPLLYFDDITPEDRFYSIVSKDFKEVSTSCYEIIKKSWSEIDRVASKPNGLSILGKKFKTCLPLKHSEDIKDYLDSLYVGAAQYDNPPSNPLLSVLCGGIDGANQEGSDILDQIFAGVVASLSKQPCYDYYVHQDNGYSEWGWQVCTEMLMPIGTGINTMFPPGRFNLEQSNRDCKSVFGVTLRPHWITTYYGGHDIKLVLQRFGSNIIFSNGLRDPYSGGGVLEDLSNTLLAVYTAKGSHCLDIFSASKTDSEWLINQRKVEVKIIEGWLKQYYADLLA